MGDAAAHIRITPVAEADREHLRRMLRVYLEELGADPEYPYLDLYWTEPQRHAYWIQVRDNVVGFALVRRLANGMAEVAEFFIQPAARRQGLGRAAAMALFATHPGRWQIRSFPGNRGSETFWEKSVPSDAQRLKDERGSSFVFTAGAAVKPEPS